MTWIDARPRTRSWSHMQIFTSCRVGGTRDGTKVCIHFRSTASTSAARTASAGGGPGKPGTRHPRTPRVSPPQALLARSGRGAKLERVLLACCQQIGPLARSSRHRCHRCGCRGRVRGGGPWAGAWATLWGSGPLNHNGCAHRGCTRKGSGWHHRGTWAVGCSWITPTHRLRCCGAGWGGLDWGREPGTFKSALSGAMGGFAPFEVCSQGT